MPTGSDDVVNVATPDVVVPVPIELTPLKKVTVSPFGTVGATVAVNVTATPDGAELGDDVVKVVVVGIWFTTCVRVLDVLAP